MYVCEHVLAHAHENMCIYLGVCFLRVSTESITSSLKRPVLTDSFTDPPSLFLPFPEWEFSRSCGFYS